MKLLVLAVGHKVPDWIRAGFGEYAKRMPREARIELVEVKPEPRTAGKSVAQIMEAEAGRILAALPPGCLRIVLDERGVQMGTRQLAQKMEGWMREGRDAAFVIGGADGLHDSVKSGAQQLWSLSLLTLPHGLARVVLAEQLYRAHSLLHNHPYHRE
jgi:23S rRNA (pseudouridine1915-N3)-methyltransferase